MEDKEQRIKEFNESVEWLKLSIPPEHIYEFAEQALMAADYFILKWREWVDLEEEVVKDKLACTWIQNIVGLRILKEMKYQGPLNISMKMLDEI